MQSALDRSVDETLTIIRNLRTWRAKSNNPAARAHRDEVRHERKVERQLRLHPKDRAAGRITSLAQAWPKDVA